MVTSACTCTHTYVHMCVCSMPNQSNTHVHVCTYVHTFMQYTCVYVRTYICMCTFTYIHTYVHIMYICAHMYTYVCIIHSILIINTQFAFMLYVSRYILCLVHYIGMKRTFKVCTYVRTYVRTSSPSFALVQIPTYIMPRMSLYVHMYMCLISSGLSDLKWEFRITILDLRPSFNCIVSRLEMSIVYISHCPNLHLCSSRLHTYLPTYKHTYLLCIHTAYNTCIRTYIYMHVLVNKQGTVHMYVHTYVCTYIRRCMHMYICMCVYIHT